MSCIAGSRRRMGGPSRSTSVTGQRQLRGYLSTFPGIGVGTPAAARTGGSRGETGAGLVELPGQDRIRRSFAGMRWFLRRSLRHSPETPPAEEGLADPPTLASALEDLARSVLRGVREMDGLASQTHETRFLQQQVESLIFIWRFARALSARPARDGVELHEVLYPRAWDMPGGYADPHDSTFVLDKHVPWGNGPYMHQPVRGRRILRCGPRVWGRSGAQPSQRGRYERAASWDRTPAPASAPARGGDLRLTLRENLVPLGRPGRRELPPDLQPGGLQHGRHLRDQEGV